MSMQAIAAAFGVTDIGANRKFILVMLANYADSDGQCWPSQEMLGAATELTDRTVRTALKELEEKGLIARQHRCGAGGVRISDLITLLI